MIISDPAILTELDLAADIQHGVLVIAGRGSCIRVSGRRLRPIGFPGLHGIEARLIKKDEGEITIGKAVLIPIAARA